MCGCHHSGVMVKKKINGIVKSCKEAVYHEQYSIEYIALKNRKLQNAFR
jgi:hypothetical protein